VEPRVTRARFLERSGIAALAAAGIYGLVDGIAAAPARALPSRLVLPAEQHLLRHVRVIAENGVEVVVPPLHHQIVTARLDVGRRKAELRDAQRALEQALARLDRSYLPTPAGLGVTVGWGRSYFQDRLPRLADGRRFPDYLPVDRRASLAAGEPHSAFLDSIRFPSDPLDAELEQNDVCFLLRSDALRHITAATSGLFKELKGLLEITSIRKGFVGGGGSGGHSLPKQMAVRARIPGAELMPDSAQLFLGFTSTQRKALGPELIANMETLPGLTDQWPNGYFRHGTTMHVSHLHEDLETWYSSFSYIRRVWATFRPGLDVADGTLTVPEGPLSIESEADVAYDAVNFRLVGHSGAIQPATRLTRGVVDNHGVHNPAGTAVIQRADFNTLDNPFFWSSRPGIDRMASHPAAGLHFVAFAATSDSFHRARLAMDGRYAGRTTTPFTPRAEEQGMNSVLRTTHRQNFLVPPRKHRSFPLVELL
jgi:hypothetical protein